MSPFDRLRTSWRTSHASKEIVSLLKDSGLSKIPFFIEFVDDNKMEITMLHDVDDPHSYETSPEEESDALAIASDFANATAQRGLAFAPGSTFEWGPPDGH